MSQIVKQIKVVISYPSDVDKEKDIIVKLCDTLSNHIFVKKNIHIKPIDWAENVPRIITGEGPQRTIDKYFKEQDYDIYIGILWKRFGEPQANGLTPTEGEFEDALKRYKKTGRPLITFFFKEEEFYPNNEYEASQSLALQKFKTRVRSLDLYNSFTADLEFQEKAFVCIHDFVETLTTVKDVEISFERIKYPEVKNYITRSVCPANEYKPDDFWIIGDKLKKDITNIVKLKNRITLIGDAGCGKTFELERIANHFSEENSPFYPQLIRLNTFTNQSIEQILPENWEKIPENQLLIILDGLDEIESKNKKDAIRKIEHFSEQHQAISIIISCRTNFYQTEDSQSSGTINGFEAYRLLDLDYDQIKPYAQLSLHSKASKFFDEIDRNTLGELLNVPFYLVKLVELFKLKSALPNQKASIFEQLLLARIKFDKEHFRTTIELDEYRSTIIKNLERIALCMETLCRNYISDDEFKMLIPDISLRNLIKHCTAWKKEEGESLKWQFEHNNIQEYLAAKALSRQSLSIIKDFVSFKPEHRKIIPSWVNAVSFLLSISDDSSLFDWILEIEPEICLKFEPDKIAKIQRIKIFKDIFSRYKEKQIWIDRDRFKNDELARFGQFEEIIEFLLTEAENAAHQTTLGNAIKILAAMLIPPDFKDRAVDLLKRTALNNLNIEINESIQSNALIALSDLKFDSKDVVERIVSKLRSSKSDWVRYGLYYFIHNSEFLDEFLDVFIDGISCASMNFSSGGTSRLSNERWELKQGLKKVQSFNSARKILDYFIENERDLNDLFVGDHDISFIAENAAKAFAENPLFLDHAVNFSLFMFKNHHNEEAGQFLLFYEKTGTRYDAFKKTLGEKKSHYKEDFLADLADEECLDYFIEQLEKGNTTDDEMWAFLQTLRWKNKELFEPFYSKINKQFDNKFELKPVPDWEQQRKERTLRDINLIFDKQDLFKEIKLIFDTEKKELFTPKELSMLRTDHWNDLYYSDLAYETLRRIAGNKDVTMETVKAANNNWDWDWFCIREIYEKMQMHEELELPQDQQKWIAEWCRSNLGKVDFKTAIQKTDERKFSIRWNAIYIWYFFRKFNLEYPKHILLDMLSFDYDRGGIEYLENHIEETDMTSRILDNIKEGIIVDDVLKNHIEYCKRHRVRDVIKYALKEMINPGRDDEIRRISLETICELSENLSELEDVLPNIKDKFKWQVVEKLLKTNSRRVYGFLENLFKISDGEDKIMASEYLIKSQNLAALRFYVDYIKGERKFSRSLFNSSPLTSLKKSDAIPFLIELLELNYQEDFEQPDEFDRLDRLVLNSLTVIALESEQNYLDVKRAIENFIDEYRSIYKNVNWLYSFLEQLERQYYVNKSERFSIDDVIVKLEEIV